MRDVPDVSAEYGNGKKVIPCVERRKMGLPRG